jgi:hypothetical protein
VVGDCLEIVLGCGVELPADLSAELPQAAFRAIDLEIAVQERNTLAVALGRLGDPRITQDLLLSVDARNGVGDGVGDRGAAYQWIGADEYTYQDGKQAIEQDFLLSRFPATTSQYDRFVKAGGYQPGNGVAERDAGKNEWRSDDGWAWRLQNSVVELQSWRNPKRNAPNLPVTSVSWREAEADCRWAAGYLPRERQMEAAARGNFGRRFL